MSVDSRLWMFRGLLLLVLVAPSFNCAEGEGGEGCDCSCLDVPDDDDDGDDDDSVGGNDDDDDPTADLPACEGSVLAAFTDDEIAPPSVASDGYLVPSEDTLEAVAASVEALTSGNAAQATAEVAVVDYELCGGSGDEAGTALWRPATAGSGRALFAWRAVDAEPLIVGVPHANFEAGTLEEGVDAFGRLHARALISTGTHRCANTAASDCDGVTGVCGGDSLPYRESDMAHVSDSVYQVAHELFADLYEDDVVVSLHGMVREGVSLSDGSADDADADSLVAAFAAALAAEFPDELVTTCNDYDGANVDEHLCGPTNVQGRYVNGSAEPCGTGADAASGRFLHVEQSGDVRDEGPRVMDALVGVLP